MKLSRSARVGGIALVGALALAACGSDNNSGSSSTSTTTGGAGASSSSAVTGTINGEGSTAQKNAIDEAVSDFTSQNSGAKVNYNATGSGAGIKSFNGGQVDWAGSDSALKTDPAAGASTSETADAQKRCGGNDAWNLPLVAGPIAVAYNLSGVYKLVLTPRLVAQIFQGKITKWNDPAIAKAELRASRCPSRRSGLLPLRRVGHDGELREVPRRRGAAGLHGDAVEDVARQRRGRARRSRPAWRRASRAPPAASATSSGRTPRTTSLGVAQIDNGGGAVELTADSAGKAVAAAQPAGTGQRPARSSSTTRPRRRASTRSSWSPTRSSARRAWTQTSCRLLKSFLNVHGPGRHAEEARRHRLRDPAGLGADQGEHGDRRHLPDPRHRGAPPVRRGRHGAPAFRHQRTPPTPERQELA